MVPLCLLTFLFILSNALVTGTETGTQAQVPCKDKPTTTKKPAIDHCRNHRGGKPYKRKSGWWCSQVSISFFSSNISGRFQSYHQDVKSNTPMTLKEGINLCEMNGYQLSSLELDQERKDYAPEEIEGSRVIVRNVVESYWVKISMNQTNGQYYWSDGYSTPTINPQPNVMDPNGAGVFTLSRDPSTPGHGRLSIVSTTGKTTGPITPFVRGVICGAPGLD
ncbi:unnamed protein product [Caenorhabditis brenneri]